MLNNNYTDTNIDNKYSFEQEVKLKNFNNNENKIILPKEPLVSLDLNLSSLSNYLSDFKGIIKIHDENIEKLINKGQHYITKDNLKKVVE